jgi:muconolactone delta-isomerase
LEVGLPLMDAMEAWIDANTKSGKMEQAWGFAGHRGGGGILNVESLEELHSIMVAMPLGPFQETKIYGLTDIKQALEAGRQAAAMMGKGV